MSTSETVQAAQRLLAEREALGLKKYGTTVDRSDLSSAQWAQHLLEELSDAVLYLIRLRETMQPAPAPAPADGHRRFGPITSDPADAERNIRAKEDAERAAYLERWKDAPAYADWLSEDSTGWCCWWQAEPILVVGVRVPYWTEGPGLTGDKIHAGHNLLGSVRCEPRPVPADGQGVEG